jgi:hypothetical protein
MGVSNEAKNVIPLKFLLKIKNNVFFPLVGQLNPGTYCISEPEGPPNKTIIFTKYRERHCVVVFPKVLLLNLYLLRTLHADEGLNIRSEFLPDLPRIMKKTKMTLIVKYF